MSLCDVSTQTSVFYLLGLSALVQFMLWRRNIASRPLRLLSFPPLELPLLSTQHVGQAPRLTTHCNGWHTRWLVCMRAMWVWVCAPVLRGQLLPEAGGLRDSKVPGSHLLRSPPPPCVVACYHHLVRVCESNRETKQQQSGCGSQGVQKVTFCINYVTADMIFTGLF